LTHPQAPWSQVWETYVAQRATFHRAVNGLRYAGWAIDRDLEDDLVHAFLVERGPHVLGAYDSSRGSLEALLFVAFKRYAITQLRTVRRQIRLLEALDTSREPSASLPTSTKLDVERVRTAVESLSSAQRLALETILQAGSLRTSAKILGVSRWAIRRDALAALRAITRSLGEELDDETILESLVSY
jgi:DNA-directed RNA polymerase specialized sigma24 family protein